MDKKYAEEKAVEELNNDIDHAIHKMAERSERVSMMAGNLQDGLEPHYEYIAKQVEMYIQQNPEEMKGFLALRKATIEGNYKDTGASADGLVRMTGSVPLGLYKILIILAPNFLGAQELSIRAKKDRAHKFFRRFPMFQFCEKL